MTDCASHSTHLLPILDFECKAFGCKSKTPLLYFFPGVDVVVFFQDRRNNKNTVILQREGSVWSVGQQKERQVVPRTPRVKIDSGNLTSPTCFFCFFALDF